MYVRRKSDPEQTRHGNYLKSVHNSPEVGKNRARKYRHHKITRSDKPKSRLHRGDYLVNCFCLRQTVYLLWQNDFLGFKNGVLKFF